MHETFDHTADLGLRIVTETKEELFVEAAQALLTVILEDLTSVACTDLFEMTLTGSVLEDLFFDWLRELLFQFDAHHRVYARFEVEFTATGLVGKAWGEGLQIEKHVCLHEVKAITYHCLRVEPTSAGWLAEVIVDI